MPNDTQGLPKDPETLMRDLAQTIHQQAGLTATGRLAAISVPVLGLEDVHFSVGGGEPVVKFYSGGGEVEQRALDAEECQALSGFFAALANLLGFRS